MSIAGAIARARQTLSHQRRMEVRGETGEVTTAWQTLASDVACWAQPASPQERTIAAQRRTVITDVVYTTTDLDARAGDRLVIGSRVLLVHGTRDLAGLSRCYAILCEEVQA